MKSNMILAVGLSVFSITGAVFAQAVIPGEFTDPSNIKKTFAANNGDYVPPENLRAPYVATYYVKPTCTTAEEVKIGFYVTDWDSSKVRFLDDSLRFDAHLAFSSNGTNFSHRVLPAVKSGDGTFNLGKLPEGNYMVGVWAVDARKRESHRVWHEFRVVAPEKLSVPKSQVYMVGLRDLEAYGISKDGAYGHEIPVEIPMPEGAKPADLTDDKIKAAFDAFVASGKLPKKHAVPGYTVLIPTRNGKVVTGSFKRSRVIYDENYDTNAVEQAAIRTTEGLQKLINDKAAAGFRELVLLPGTYRVSAARKIVLPDNFTLDLGGATLKENQFTGCHAVVVDLTSAYDAHLVNGTIEGDYYEHDYANSPSNSEWPMGFTISADSRYSSVERIRVRNITGYGGGNGLGKDARGGYQLFYAGVNKFVPGGLKTSNGIVDETDKFRFTSDFLAVDKYRQHKYLQVSKYLGYQGRATRSWLLTACWYDAEKNFLASETLFQYRPVPIPTRAAYLRFSVETASLDEANKAGLTLTLFRIPWNCAVKKCVFERCRAVGYAASQMKNMLFEDNEFMYSGESLAKCAFDAEDGWDQMQDVYFKGNWFHDNPINNSILTCAGHNFILENNRCNIHFWGRTHSPCVRNNTVGSATYSCDSRLRSGYGRFENNSYSGLVNIRGAETYNGWDFVLSGIDFTKNDGGFKINAGPSGRLVKCVFTNTVSTFANASGCRLIGCKSEYHPGGHWYGVTAEDCDIRYMYKTNVFEKCTFRNTTFTRFDNGRQTFRDCTFEGGKFVTLNAANLNFVNCTFNGTVFENSYWDKPANLSFSRCSVNVTNGHFVKIALYAIGGLAFDSCSFVNSGEKDGALLDLGDLRAQPTDNLPGTVTARGCKFTGNFKSMVRLSGHKPTMSAKKITVATEKLIAPQGMDIVPDAASLASWTVK